MKLLTKKLFMTYGLIFLSLFLDFLFVFFTIIVHILLKQKLPHFLNFIELSQFAHLLTIFFLLTRLKKT